MAMHDKGKPSHPVNPERRKALTCLAGWTGAAVVWTVAGGVPQALGVTNAGAITPASRHDFTFVQISDTHIGFHKDANPDVVGSLRHAIADINALPQRPALVVHTGDVSHLSKPEEFGQASELLREIHVDRVHTVPGEHDALDAGLDGYLKFFDHDGQGRTWYSFDQGGAHFIGLSNVLNFKMGTLTALGDEQIACSRRILPTYRAARRSSCWRIFQCGRSMRRGAGARPMRDRRWHCCAPTVRSPCSTAMSIRCCRRSKATSPCTQRCHSPTRCRHLARRASANPDRSRLRAGELGRLLGTRQIHVVPGRHALATIDTPIDHA